MYTILSIVLFLFAIAWVLILLDLVLVAAKMDAPFVSSPTELLTDITSVFEIKDGDTVYEPGCGDARVSCALAKNYPNAKFVGVDSLFTAVILARLRVQKMKLSNVQIKWGNLYKEDLSRANHMFLWIFPHMMTKLRAKLEQELPTNAKVVAMDFGFQGKTADKEILLNYTKKNYAKKLYLYTFNPS